MKITSGWILLVLCMLSFPLLAQQQEEEPSPVDDATSAKPAAVEQEVQEVKYVTDKLRLSLYKKADSNSGTLKLLVSGDELDVLEKTGPYSKVRTKSGLTGWVKNGFLVSTPTASFQLIEEQEKNRILAQQIEKYADSKSLVAEYENTIQKIDSDAARLTSELEQARQALQEQAEQNEVLSQQLESSQQDGIGLHDARKILLHYWYFAVAFALLMILIGFTTGRELVEARIRRKFQGVKVW